MGLAMICIGLAGMETKALAPWLNWPAIAIGLDSNSEERRERCGWAGAASPACQARDSLPLSVASPLGEAE